jgi:uncharacterized protein (TIGR03083 family)
MAQLTPDRYYGAIAQATAELADVVPDTDTLRQVPTCPDWTFGHLVQHVGTAHRWATAIVERRATEFVPFETLDDRDSPDDPGKRADWLRGGAQRLIETMQAAGPDAPVWTFVGPGDVAFWLRRMAHETSIHAMDGLLTAERRVSLPADLAADCISEGLDLFALAAAQGARDLGGNGETLHFHSRDGWLGRDGEWFVRRTPEGLEWSHAHEKADVAVRGNAADLALLLTRRVPLETAAVEVLGDGALLEHWLANAAF